MTPPKLDLAAICPELATLDQAFKAFDRDQIGITRTEWDAIAATMLKLAEENERLKKNQKPFTMPDIDGMTAKEDGTYQYRPERRRHR